MRVPALTFGIMLLSGVARALEVLQSVCVNIYLYIYIHIYVYADTLLYAYYNVVKV